MEKDIIYSELFTRYGVRHGFSSRQGGVSSGNFESMNVGLSSADSAENIKKNFSLLSEKLKMDLFSAAMGRQSHSDNIMKIGSESLCGREQLFRFSDTDGFVTSTENIPLAVFWADCVPVLLADKNKRAAGAVHSGWRGTVKGIAGKCADIMVNEFGIDPSEIICAIGPAVCGSCYQVNADVFNELAASAQGAGCTKTKDEKFFCDLQKINKQILINHGIKQENIDVIERCTCCEGEYFFSHRRMGGERGLQLAAVMLQTRGSL